MAACCLRTSLTSTRCMDTAATLSGTRPRSNGSMHEFSSSHPCCVPAISPSSPPTMDAIPLGRAAIIRASRCRFWPSALASPQSRSDDAARSRTSPPRSRHISRCPKCQRARGSNFPRRLFLPSVCAPRREAQSRLDDQRHVCCPTRLSFRRKKGTNVCVWRSETARTWWSKMPERVLITGGAGFIGSHVSDLLLDHGYSVRILDNLSPQVHSKAERPGYLAADAELIIGDVCDRACVESALRNVDAVVHLAASVGVGQSMYQIAAYTNNNDVGTATLLDALSQRPVRRLVCASSMSVYGEGSCRRPDGEAVSPDERSNEQLRRGDWELRDADGTRLEPVPTAEDKTPCLSSVYALNKFCQERLCLIAG